MNEESEISSQDNDGTVEMDPSVELLWAYFCFFGAMLVGLLGLLCRWRMRDVAAVTRPSLSGQHFMPTRMFSSGVEIDSDDEDGEASFMFEATDV